MARSWRETCQGRFAKRLLGSTNPPGFRRMADRCRRAALDAWGLDAITRAMVDTLQDPSWTTRMMWRATVRLNLAYWPAIFVADSILSSFIGIGPIESAGAKI